MSKQKPHQLLETIVQQIPGDNYPEVHDAVTALRQLLAPKVSKTGKQKGRPPKKPIHGPMVAWYVDQFTERLDARQHAKPRMTAYQLVSLKFGIGERYARKMADDFRDQAAEPMFSSRMRALIKHSSLSLDADLDQLLARFNYNVTHD